MAMPQPPVLTLKELMARAEEYRKMATATAFSSKARAILINEAVQCERMVAERERQIPAAAVCC
jgi:hypothetical protein